MTHHLGYFETDCNNYYGLVNPLFTSSLEPDPPTFNFILAARRSRGRVWLEANSPLCALSSLMCIKLIIADLHQDLHHGPCKVYENLGARCTKQSCRGRVVFGSCTYQCVTPPPSSWAVVEGLCLSLGCRSSMGNEY